MAPILKIEGCTNIESKIGGFTLFMNFVLLKMLTDHSYWEEIGWLKMVSGFILILGVYELVKRMSLWLKIFILLLFYVHVGKQSFHLRHRLFVM